MNAVMERLVASAILERESISEAIDAHAEHCYCGGTDRPCRQRVDLVAAWSEANHCVHALRWLAGLDPLPERFAIECGLPVVVTAGGCP